MSTINRQRPRWIAWWIRRVAGKPDTGKAHAFCNDPESDKGLVALCGATVAWQSRLGKSDLGAGMEQFWGPESSDNPKCRRCLAIYRKREEEG